MSPIAFSSPERRNCARFSPYVDAAGDVAQSPDCAVFVSEISGNYDEILQRCSRRRDTPPRRDLDAALSFAVSSCYVTARALNNKKRARERDSLLVGARVSSFAGH